MHKTPRINENKFQTFLYIPPLWDFFLVQKKNKNNFKNIFIFSNTYFVTIPLHSDFSFIKFYSDAKVVSFYFKFYNSSYRYFWNSFKNVFYSFSKIFFKKLKFKGKGYYIYKNIRNTIALQMGYSHIIRLYAFKVHVKFTAKTVIFMFGLNRRNLTTSGFSLKKLKPINIFTGRGIRFSRQIVYRKTGKMSAYR